MEYPRSLLYFLGIHTNLKASVYTKKIQLTSGIFHGYTTRKGCLTILYHTIENTVANAIKATYTRRMMGRFAGIPWLSCVRIGCIFYNAVSKRTFSCTNLAVLWLARLTKMRSDPTSNNVKEMSCSMFFLSRNLD